MAKTTCDIQFDNNQRKVFFSGQPLQGKVILRIHKEKVIRGIYIKIFGRAYCNWDTGSKEQKENHWGEEFYFSEKTYFLGSTIGTLTIKPNVYNFTFQCELPVGLPTSVEGEQGYIRYSAIVILERPIWPDQQFEEMFTVIKPLDLNLNPSYRIGLEKEYRKKVRKGCLLCCFENGELHSICRIPLSGYAPGQTIDFDIEVHNGSSRNVKQHIVQLVKVINYFEHEDSYRCTSDNIILVGDSTDGCPKHEVKTVKAQLRVPPIPPTDTTTSNICKVHYLLRIISHMSGCIVDPRIEIPITIGTVPLRSNLISSVNDDNECQSIEWSQTTPPTAPQLQDEDEDIPPPTYEEAMKITKNASFVPLYPVYRYGK